MAAAGLAAAGLLLPSGCASTADLPAGTTIGSSSGGGMTSPPASPHPSSAEPTISSQPAPDAELHGTVHGVVVREAGRDPRSGGGSTTGSVPVGADPVTASPAGTSQPVARTVTAQDGSFEFQLRPGAYLITEEITGASAEVAVTSDLTSTLTLTVPGA